MYYEIEYSEVLAHHGILGQKWGVRRYQNADGSLTSAGKARYGSGDKKSSANSADDSKTSAVKKAVKVAKAVATAGRPITEPPRQDSPVVKRPSSPLDEQQATRNKLMEQGGVSSARANGKTDAQRATEAQKRTDAKNRGTLTTGQLQQKIKRLQMEKQLHDLTNEEVNSGKKIATDILTSVGKQVATTALKGAALYAVKAAITREFNVKDFGTAVFNGGAKKK